MKRQSFYPLVLLPGARGGSLMWTHNVASLSAHYRVYAPDIIGDVGLSVNRYEIANPDDLANWGDEVLTVLVPEGQLRLVAISYGGWIAGEYAIRRSGRLRKVVLLAPGGIVLPNSFRFMVRIGLLLIPLPGRSGPRFDECSPGCFKTRYETATPRGRYSRRSWQKCKW